MKNNIKIFAIAALLLLLGSVCPNVAFAELVPVNIDLKNKCLTGNNDAITLFTDGIPTGKTTPDVSDRLTSPKLASISFIVYQEDDHTVDEEASEFFNSNYTDLAKIANGECSLFAGPSITTAGSGSKTRYFIKHLNLTPKATNFSHEYYGRKMAIQFMFTGNALANVTVSEIITFEMVIFGGGKVDNRTALTDDIIDGYYMDFLCEGDPVYIKIGNSEHPYGSKYTAEYNWTVKEGAGSPYNYVTSNSKDFTDDHFTVGKSKLIQFTPFMTLKEGSENVCENMKFSDSYLFYYRSNVTADFTINGVRTSAATVCSEDEVEVEFDLYQDGEEFYYADAALYLDEINGVPTGSSTPIDENNFYETGDDQKFSIGTLTTVGGRNTTYKYKLVVKDRTHDDDYDGDEISHCESVMYFTVRVLERDATVELTSDGSHCENEDVVITMSSLTTSGVATDYTYQLRRKVKDADDSSAANIPTSDAGNKYWFQVTDPSVPKGDYVYMMYIMNQGGCEYKAGEIEVHVAEAPVIAADNITICKNDDAIIDLKIDNTSTQPDPSTYTYTWTAGISGIDASKDAEFSKTIIPSPTTTTPYTVTATNDMSHCTSKPKTVVVNVNPLPDIQSISGPDNACLNSGVTLSPVLVSTYTPVASPIEYTWTRKDGSTVIEKTTGATYTYTLDKEYSVIVSAKDKNGCSSSITQTKKVYIQPLPDFKPSAKETCSGDNWIIKMNNKDGRSLTYSFTSSSVGAPAISTTTSDEFTLASPSSVSSKTSYVYTVKAVDENGCDNTEELILTVNPLPVVTELTSSKTEQCFGSSVTLTAKASSKVTPSTLTYAWYDGSTLLSGSSNTIDVTPSSAGKHTYKVVVSDANGCTASKTVDVTFYEITTVEVVPDKTTICKGETVALSATLGAGAQASDYEFLWSNSETKQNITVTPNVTTPYSVQIKQKVTSCIVESAERVITVNQLPAFTMEFDKEVCKGVKTEVTLTMVPDPSTPAPTSYTWVSGGSASDFSATSDVNVFKANMSWSESTVYEYYATANGCNSSVNTTKELVVNTLPATPAATASPVKICKGKGEKVTLQVTSPDKDLNYFWFTDAECTVALNGDAAKTSTVLSATVTGALVSSTTYYVKAVHKTTGCESAASPVTLTVNAIPAATLDLDNDDFCEGGSAKITASIDLAGTYTYAWTSDPEGYTADTKDITVTPSQTTTYKLVAKNTTTGCETVPATKKVTVNQLPDFTVAPANTDVCNGVESDVIITMTPDSEKPEITEYIFTPADFSATANPNEFKATRSWTSNTTYSIVAKTAKTCSSEPRSIKVSVNPIPATPTATASPVKICKGKGEKVTLQVTSPDKDLNYFWFTDAECTVALNGDAAKTSTVLSATVTGALVSSTTYYVKAVHKTTGCESAASPVTLTVNAIPAAELTIDNSEFCVGTKTANITVSIAEPGTYTYKWTASPADPSLVSTSMDISVSPKVTTKYTLVATNSTTGCVTEEAYKTVTINQLPDFSMKLEDDQVCNGVAEELTLKMTPTAASETVGAVDHYEFVSGGSSTDFVLDSEDANVYNADMAWTSNTTYTFKAVSDKTCYSEPKSVTVYVNEIPATPIAKINKSEICKGAEDQIVLSLESTQSGVNYFWYSDPGCTASLNGDVPATSINLPTAETSALDADQTYYVKAVNATSGCEGSAYGSVTLKINAIPAATLTVDGDSEFCIGGSTTIKSSISISDTYDYQWTSSPADPSLVSTSKDISVSPSETTTYTLVATNSKGCKTAAATETITVYQKPVFTIQFDKEVCEGEEATVKMTMSTTDDISSYSFISGGTEFAKVSTGEYVATSKKWNSNTTYTFTGKSDKGCVSEKVSGTLIVNPQPAAPDFDFNKAQICKGETTVITMTVNSPVATSTYKWYQGDTYLDEGTSYTLPANPDVTTEYTCIEYSLEGCTGKPGKKSLKVNELPTVTISGDNSICEGEYVTLTANPVAGAAGSFDPDAYTWYKDGIVISGENSQTLLVSPSGNTNYSVSVVENTAANCLSAVSAEHLVTVNKLPVIEVSDLAYACEGTTDAVTMTINVTNDIASSFTINGDVNVTGIPTEAGTSATVSLEPLGTNWTAGNIIIEIAAKSEAGCDLKVNTTKTLVVNPRPTINNAYSDRSEQCLGQLVTLTVDAASNIADKSLTYEWYEGTELKGNGASLPLTESVAGDHFYNAVVTDANGCSTKSSDVKVTFTKMATVAIAYDVTEICIGDPVKLKASLTDADVADYTFAWSSGETTEDITVYPSDNITYVATYNHTATGCDATESIDITVHQKPTFDISFDREVCSGEEATVTITLTKKEESEGIKEFSLKSGSPVFTEKSLGVYEATDIWTVNTDYTFVATSDFGCPSTDVSATLVVNDHPAAPEIQLSNLAICNGQTADEFPVILSVVSPNEGSTYTWYLGTTELGTGTSLTLAENPTVDTEYSCVELSAKECTSDVAYITLHVYELPTVAISGDNEVCETKSVTLTATPTAGNAGSFASDAYTWYADGVEITGENASEITVSPLDNTQYTVVVVETGLNANCPSAVSSVHSVTVNKLPVIEVSDLAYACEGTTDAVTMTINVTNDIASSFTINGDVNVTGIPTEAGTSATVSLEPLGANWSAGDIIIEIAAKSEAGCDLKVNTTKTLVVNPRPTVNSASSDNDEQCLGHDVTLTVDAVSNNFADPSLTYEWYEADVLKGTGASLPLTEYVAGDHIYNAVVTDANGCSTKSSDVKVKFTKMADVIITPDVSICIGEPVVLTASLDGADIADYTFAWSSGETSETITVYPTEDTQYAAVYTHTATGCTAANVVNVTVHQLPTIAWKDDETADILCLDGEERLFTFESTDGHEIVNSLWDINSFHFGSVNTVPQISIKAVSPDQVAGNTYTIKVYSLDEYGCQSLALEKDVEVVAIPKIDNITDGNGVETVAFNLCEGNPLKFTVNSTPATGDYTYIYTKDGVVLDDWTSNSASVNMISTSDMAGNYTVAIYDNYSKCTSAEYAFTIDFPLPVADLTVTPASKLVISGTSVKLTVTPGYSRYEFYVGGVLIADGVENEVSYSAMETASVSVNVYNEYDCYITLEDVVSVLEGVADCKVEITADQSNDDNTEAFYCSTNRDAGASIRVINPQIGITYVLSRIEDDVQIGEPIEALDGVDVAWNTNTAVETSPALTKSDNTYKVTAFHSSLPDEKTVMSQQVALSEIYGGINETVTPKGSGEECTGETFKISGALPGYSYSLFLNGSLYGSSVVATSDYVELPNTIAFTGKYEVYRYNPTYFVCGMQKINEYVIPEVEAAKVSIYADDRLTSGETLVGYYCFSDDKKGVDITIENSEEGQDYVLYYQSSASDVPVNTGITVKGTGDDLLIRNTADIMGDGLYSLGFNVNNCIQLVSENILEVVGYTAPDKSDFNLTYNSYFCEGSDELIQISGVLKDYYSYRLVRIAPTYEVSATVLYGSDPAAFVVTEGGKYQIEVINTNLQNLNLTCANTLLDPFDVVRLDTPTPITASFDKSDFCLDSSDEAYAVIKLSGLAPDVYYTIYEDGVVVSDKLSNSLENINDASGNGVKSFELSLTEGTHNYLIKGYRKAEGFVVCDMVNVATASVRVRPRPGVAGETVVVNSSPVLVEPDECYGVDIEIDNSREGYTYTLHSDADGSVFTDGGYAAAGHDPKSSVEGTGDKVVFYNISVNGKFYVTVNYSDGSVDCEDIVDYVTVNEDFLEVVSPSLTVSEMCQGSGATQVVLNKWQDIAYYELLDAHNNVVANSDDAVKVVDGTLTFNREFRTGNFFTVVAYRLKDVDGDGVLDHTCPVTMGSVTFTVYPLPRSYELSGRNIYCGDKSDIQLILPESEPDVEYTLYVWDSNTNQWAEYFDEDGNKVSVMGNDEKSELYFPRTSSTDQRFLDKNLYTVIAYNTVTNCTSAMKNEVEVIKRDDLKNDPVLPKNEYKSCQGEPEKVVIPADKTQKFVTYYIYHSEDAEELARIEAGVTSAMLAEIVEDQDKADDIIIRKYTGSNLTFAPNTVGNYVIIASYDEFACPTFVDKFSYTVYNIDKYQLDAIAHCGGNVEYVLNGKQEGVDYYAYVDGAEFAKISDPESFSLNIADITPETFVTVVAKQGLCEVEMGGKVYPYTKTIPTVNVFDVTYSAHMCEQGVYEFNSENTDLAGMFQSGMTYYFMINGEDPKTGASPIVMRKADDNGNIEARIPVGTYTVWATFEEEFDCFETMTGKFVISQDIIEAYRLTSSYDCVNGFTVTLENPYDSYSYELVADDATIEAVDNANWKVSGSGEVVFSLNTVVGACPKPASVTIDFDGIKQPTGTLDILLNGNDLEDGEEAAFCNQTSVRLIGSVSNLPEVTEYRFNYSQYTYHDELICHDEDITEDVYNEIAESDPENTHKQILTRLEKYFLYNDAPFTDPESGETVIKRDSVSTGDIFITYTDGVESSRVYINTADESTAPTNDLGEVIETYKYWQSVCETAQVADVVAIDSVSFVSSTASTKADMSMLLPGKYKVSMTAVNGECVYPDVASLDFEITEVPVANVDTTLQTICGDATIAQYKAKLDKKYTYYFYRDGSTVPFVSAVPDANDTISVELPEGIYTVSADSKYDCLTPMEGSIIVKHDTFNNYELIAAPSPCAGKYTVTLTNPNTEGAYVYSLYSTVEGASAATTADPYVWDVEGAGKVTFTLVVGSENGCETTKDVVVDFDSYEAPKASVIMLIDGEEVSEPAFCNQKSVRLMANVLNVPSIKNYEYKFYKYSTELVDEVETTSLLHIDDSFDISSESSIVVAEGISQFDPGKYQIRLTVTNDECKFDNLVLFDFDITEIPVVSVDTTLQTICGDATVAQYNAKLNKKYTYYFYRDGSTVPFISVVPDANDTISVELPEGIYTVSADSKYDCLTPMDGAIIVKHDIFNDYELVAAPSPCAGKYTVSLTNPNTEGAYVYSLYSTVEGASAGTTADPYVWDVEGAGKVTFTLVVGSENGCETTKDVVVDFDSYEAPKASVIMLIDGEEVSEPAFCNQKSVRLMANVLNVPSIKNYEYKFYKYSTELVDEVETTSLLHIDDSFDISTDASIVVADAISQFSAGKYQVRLTVTNDDCKFEDLVLFDFEITEVPVINVAKVLPTICGDAETATYEYDQFTQGYVYYFFRIGEATPFVSVTPDENNTISLELPEGIYTVSADSKYDCLTPMEGTIEVSHDYFKEEYVLTYEMSPCDGKATVKLQNPDAVDKNYTYSLSTDADGATATLTADPYTWDVAGNNVVVYTLTVRSQNGCEKMTDITVDFSKYVAPVGSMSMILDGEEFTSTSELEFCKDRTVTFITNVQNIPVVNEYLLKFYKRVNTIVDDVEVSSLEYIGEEFDKKSDRSTVKVDLSDFAQDAKYQVQVDVSNDDCTFTNIARYDFTLSVVPLVDVSATLDMICDADPTAHYESDIYKVGYTYYFTRNNDSEVFATAIPDENGLIALELPEGIYTVSADSKYDCLTPMEGSIVVTRDAFYEYVAPVYDCNNIGSVVVPVMNVSADHEYAIIVPEDAVAPVEVPDLTNIWVIEGTGEVTYTLSVKSKISACEKNIPFVINFNTFVAPVGSFDIIIEGKKWEKNDTIMPQICSSSSVSMLADVEGMEVGTYKYEFFKVLEQIDDQTGAVTLVTDTVEFAHSTSSTDLAPQYFADYDQSQRYRVFLSVESKDGCGPYPIDTVDFYIKGAAGLVNRFMPDPSHLSNVDTVSCLTPGHTLELHGEYCADESGVGLFFKDAKPGNIYRLFQKVTEKLDSVNVRETVELLDMQEVPDYSSIIKDYVAEPIDSLWFTGWGVNGSGNAYGATGSVEGTSYFVSVEETDGCITNTPDLIIYENPLPVDTVTTSPTYNEVYYALLTVDENGNEYPNMSVKSNDYGIVDAGYVILSNPQSGIYYELRHVDSPLGSDYLVSHIVCDDRTQERGWVSFGKVRSDDEAIAEGWGSGIYEVIAINPLTNCSVSVGSIEFIDEELVAYNVYLYINKKHNTTSQLLYPSPEKFGNHRYIDWSRKVDVVWSPALLTDSVTGLQYIDQTAEDFEKRSGYSIYEKNANIHFEMVQAMKDTVTYHDVDITEAEYEETFSKDPDNTHKELLKRLEKYFLYNEWAETDTLTGEVTVMRDSVSTGDILISYKNGKEESRTYINTQDDKTKPTNDLGAVIETYRYWHTVYDTIQVPDFSRKYGDYGFDPDYDAVETPELVQDSKSGLFRYTKMPSFFGKVELTYRIYNDLLPTIRFSNNAQIVILCGNNNIPGMDAVFHVPNAFSPNGDGYNDEFQILLPHNYENSQVILEVFNRWGTRVYKSSGLRYGIDCPYWDGTSTTSNMVTVGEKLPSGTYYYVLTIKVNNPSTGETQDLDLKGFIELRR